MLPHSRPNATASGRSDRNGRHKRQLRFPDTGKLIATFLEHFGNIFGNKGRDTRLPVASLV